MKNRKFTWLWYSDRLHDEFRQSCDEGKDMEGIEEKIVAISAMEDGPLKEASAHELLLRIDKMPVDEKLLADEPDDYDSIIGLLGNDHLLVYEINPITYRNKLKGAWYGRAIGCLLGIPVEGWHRDKIKSFLKDTGNYPLSRYMSSNIDTELKNKYNIRDLDNNTPYDRQLVCWINNVKSFPVDDDTNYTISALRVAERCGLNFTSVDIAQSWLYSVPALHMCTAERVAYQNLLNLIMPPESGRYLNPYREWIGAQIRADFYGYVSPGNPSAAAEMAYKDAVITHTRNGIYGEMLAAAMISIGASSSDPLVVVKGAMKQIPPKSRLHLEMSKLCEMYERGLGFSELIDYIHNKYDEKIGFDWCHTIPNALIVAACVLCFGNDFNQAITKAVESGFDTDCNGATVGSIVGMMVGFPNIDGAWMQDIAPIINTSVNSYSSLTIEDAVNRTMDVMNSSI